jgi:hypothetical protein
MRKNFLIPVLLFSLSASAQQSEFVVAAGTQRTLTTSERTLTIKNFVLGDNAAIIIPPGMDGWTVTATDASIGTNVKIIGRGANGNNGANGSAGANGQPCKMGSTGMNGGYGYNGTAGKNVSLNLKIRKIGSLEVLVSGGTGGVGGSGGRGGNGGNATCLCNGGNGGYGGSGGRGGNGGNGGTVSITYSKLGNVTVSNSSFIVSNKGGAAGNGGAAALGGQGGAAGGCTDPKAAIRTAGAVGFSGGPGYSGAAGKNGVTTLKAL